MDPPSLVDGETTNPHTPERWYARLLEHGIELPPLPDEIAELDQHTQDTDSPDQLGFEDVEMSSGPIFSFTAEQTAELDLHTQDNRLLDQLDFQDFEVSSGPDSSHLAEKTVDEVFEHLSGKNIASKEIVTLLDLNIQLLL